MKRAYGYRRSPDDPRDKIANPAGLTILPEVDLRGKGMPLVFDQARLGSCTSQAVETCLQHDLSLDRYLQGLGSARRQSRLDIYYGERDLEGVLGQGDTGAYGRDGFEFARKTGVLLETVWPYTVDASGNVLGWEGPPPASGARRKLAKPYAAVQQDIDHVKAVLSNKQMIAFGFEVYASFESGDVAARGIVPMPRAGETRVGGHEVVVAGYLSAYPDHCLCRNSWSAQWGIGGYFMMPWAYLLDASLTGDLRTIVRATA